MTIKFWALIYDKNCNNLDLIDRFEPWTEIRKRLKRGESAQGFVALMPEMDSRICEIRE